MEIMYQSSHIGTKLTYVCVLSSDVRLRSEQIFVDLDSPHQHTSIPSTSTLSSASAWWDRSVAWVGLLVEGRLGDNAFEMIYRL
jgi:hypothetical protein